MPYNVQVAARRRPSRLQVALAAAWLVLSLAVGGAVSARSAPDAASTIDITRTATP